MAQPEIDEPLDPAIEAIRQKMMRLLFVSGGIMMIGLMAVLITIVYKINQGSGSGAARLVSEAEIAIPAGATIMDTALDGERMMLTLKQADGSIAIHIYGGDGKAISRFGVK